MSVRIEINYLDRQKPRGVVGCRQPVKVNSAFQVFSNNGALKFRFKGDFPFAQDPGELAGNTDHIATKPGHYKFKCTIHTPDGNDVELDPDNLANGVGGEMEVIP